MSVCRFIWARRCEYYYFCLHGFLITPAYLTNQIFFHNRFHKMISALLSVRILAGLDYCYLLQGQEYIFSPIGVKTLNFFFRFHAAVHSKCFSRAGLSICKACDFGSQKGRVDKWLDCLMINLFETASTVALLSASAKAKSKLNTVY